MSGAVFIGPREVFDTVDVDIPVVKHSSFGNTWVEHQWYHSYWTGRSQSVIVYNTLFGSLPVSIGVFQDHF